MFTHYGVELWVPEVGGPVDPDSEAHDLVMSVFGGMSKGERNRVKIRVRAAMSAQAAAGRPVPRRPAAIRLPARRRRAAPQPGQGRRRQAPAQARTRPGHRLGGPADLRRVPRRPRPVRHRRGPHPRRRSRPRPRTTRPATGTAPAKAGPSPPSAAILTNPRYTGRQVWNKQRKDEILLDVNDVAAGYETRMRWNQPGSWVWSDAIAHEPLISAEDFEAVQAVMANSGRARRGSREAHQRVTRPYVLRGRLYCGYCGRRMQGQYSNHVPYYRCRYPGNTPWPATSLIPATSTSAKPTCCPPSTGGWRTSSPRTASSRPSARCKQPRTPAQARHPARRRDTQSLVADCDARLARYQAALDAGADPQAVAEWTRQVKNERAAALARDTSQNRQPAARPLTEDDIRTLVTGLGDLRDVIRDAAAAVKAAVYTQLGLKVTYLPGEDKIRADVTISPEIFAGQRANMG